MVGAEEAAGFRARIGAVVAALLLSFGDEVVDHYVNMADVELAAYDATVTDSELRRGFERM